MSLLFPVFYSLLVRLFELPDDIVECIGPPITPSVGIIDLPPDIISQGSEIFIVHECAGGESNSLPMASEATALSNELPAHDLCHST